MEAPSPGGTGRRLWLAALVIAVPWLWFAVRDVGGPMDVVAVGLPLVGVVAIVVTAVAAVASGRAWPLLAGTSLFLVCAVCVLAPRFPRATAAPDPAIGLVMANVFDENPTPEAVPSSVFGRGGDVVVAVELHDPHASAALQDASTAAGLPHTVQDGELGVWSRFPLRELSDIGLPPERVMRVGVDAPGTPFVLYVVHALNPLRDTSFGEQRAMVDEILAAIEAERRPVVMAGDFNMSDRVSSYRVIDGMLTDAMRDGAAGRTTYVGGWWTAALLRIDHIFVGEPWCADAPGTFAVTGSDHRGVEASVGPCA